MQFIGGRRVEMRLTVWQVGMSLKLGDCNGYGRTVAWQKCIWIPGYALCHVISGSVPTQMRDTIAQGDRKAKRIYRNNGILVFAKNVFAQSLMVPCSLNARSIINVKKKSVVTSLHSQEQSFHERQYQLESLCHTGHH